MVDGKALRMDENETTRNGIVRSPSALQIEDPKEQLDDDGKPRRTGTVWTSSAHIITAVIGSGVLSIPWSIGQLGWVAGPITLFLFALCTLYTSRRLADCYRHPDPVAGNRNYIYMDAVKANLSRRAYWVCGILQYSNLVGTAIGYTITTATAARAIQKTDCVHQTRGQGECLASTTPYIAIYGAVQILLSQIPNFAEIWWLSYVAALMSFTYSFIVLGLGIGKAVTKQSQDDSGTLWGVGIGDPSLIGYETEAQKIWNIFIALGNIAFAYGFSQILIEIQDTIRNPPSERKQMKRATVYGVSVTTFFYMSIGITGYLAFGNSVCGNILTCFETPYWLVDFANTCVVIHLVGAYQVYTQPVFQFVETSISKEYPNNNFLNKTYGGKFISGRNRFEVNVFRLLWRTGYVVIVTVISMVIPFFNDIVGILGALGFWPLTVYFPISMYIVQHKIPRWSRLGVGLQLLNFVTFLVTCVALVGSLQGIIVDLKDIRLFKAS
ncbi:unnamed protein product [Calypogeia fissa]